MYIVYIIYYYALQVDTQYTYTSIPHSISIERYFHLNFMMAYRLILCARPVARTDTLHCF